MKVHLIEKEFKYTIDVDFSIKKQWEKEHLVYQWYENENSKSESKLKVIIDLKTFSQRFVRVTKERLNNSESNKTVEYLDIIDLNQYNFIEMPFVLKRRSIDGDFFLDKMIYSSLGEINLLEIENQKYNDEILKNLSNKGISNLVNVTEDVNYRNVKLTIPFKEMHYKELISFLNIIR